ncbi:NUMOD4 motif-containing HNH endonuclease [Brachybacterium alimentarium]|uniref:NUMOD4 motif-containing HNH endonuclease n=1 Tax=Brachybacterium alimentarium TaxID=47845 RepID=UPI003FD2AA0F
MDIAEEWRPVVGHEGIYEVSSRGRVRSLDRVSVRGIRLQGRVLAQRRLPNGRPRVSLARDGVTTDAYPYRLALEAFVGPCPPGAEALHWDDNVDNGNIENLRWGTRADNMRDASRNGIGNVGLTHCPSGHSYSPENTYLYPTGRQHRLCRTCQRERGRRRRARAREKELA